jgi:ATP-dependent DNA ligase
LAKREGSHQALCSKKPLATAASNWLHDIKHDGFRIIARRNGKNLRLSTRNSNDFTDRFPLIVAAVAALPVGSGSIDGEAIVTDEAGLAVFERLLSWRHDHAALPSAFDVIDLDGKGLRRALVEERTLARLVREPKSIVHSRHSVSAKKSRISA